MSNEKAAAGSADTHASTAPHTEADVQETSMQEYVRIFKNADWGIIQNLSETEVVETFRCSNLAARLAKAKAKAEAEAEARKERIAIAEAQAKAGRGGDDQRGGAGRGGEDDEGGSSVLTRLDLDRFENRQKEREERMMESLVSRLNVEDSQESIPVTELASIRFAALLDAYGDRNVTQFKPDPSLPALFDSAEYERVRNAKDESDLCQILVELLGKKLASKGREIFRSETLQWLRSKSGFKRHNMKPDLLISHRAFMTFSDSGRAKPGHEKVLPAVDIVDVKCVSDLSVEKIKRLNFQSQPIGELFQHLERVAGCKQFWAKQNQVSTRGALMSKSGVCLVQYLEKVLTSVLLMNWTDAGSEKEFCEFFGIHDRFTTLLLEACEAASVDVVNVKSQPFLGCGRDGFVFKVSQRSPDTAAVGAACYSALKVVVREEASLLLLQESEALDTLKFSHPELSEVMVEKVSYHPIERDGIFSAAALLMQPAGISVTMHIGRCDDTEGKLRRLRKAVAAGLRALIKLHKRFVYHGDARIYNTLWVDPESEELRWCDFSHASIHSFGRKQLAIVDVLQFLESVRIPCKHQRNEALLNLIKNYAATVSLATPTDQSGADVILAEIIQKVDTMLQQNSGDRIMLKNKIVGFAQCQTSAVI